MADLVPTPTPHTHATSLVKRQVPEAVPKGTFSPAHELASAYFRQARGAAKTKRDRDDEPATTANVIVFPHGEAGNLGLRHIMAGSWMITTPVPARHGPNALGAFTIGQANQVLLEFEKMADEEAAELDPEDPHNFHTQSEFSISKIPANKRPSRYITTRGIWERFTFYGLSVNNARNDQPKNPTMTFQFQGLRKAQDVFLNETRLGHGCFWILKRRVAYKDGKEYSGALAYHLMSYRNGRPPRLQDYVYQDRAGFMAFGIYGAIGHVANTHAARPSRERALRACCLQAGPQDKYVSTNDAYLAATQLPELTMALHQCSTQCVVATI